MLKVNDIIVKAGRVWRVEGVYLGCTGQEGLIELRNLFEKPGVPGRTGQMTTTFVPEPLLREVEHYRRVEED